MRYPGFINGNYQSQSPIADAERCVNFFWERMESQGASSEAALYPTPGVEEIVQSAYGPGRGHFFQNGREFAVFGTAFHEIGIHGALTSRGTVALDGNPATISSNGDGGAQLLVTSGGNGYIFDLLTAVFTQVTALNGKATMGDSLDGYFLVLDGNTSTFYISDLLDGLTFDTGTAFAQRSIASDPWIAMKVNGRYVWLMGEQTSEVWYDAGASSFPFAPHPSGLIPYGCKAPFSVVVADGQIIWLGASATGDNYVLRAPGFQPDVVSDYAIQNTLAKYSVTEGAVADVFNYQGHMFYRISFPRQDATWCWDVQLGKWFEWTTWIAEENRYVACRALWHAMAFGEHRFLDSSTGSLYRCAQGMSLDVDSRPIRRMRRAPALTAENQRVFYSAFELDLEVGLGFSEAGIDDGARRTHIRVATGVNDRIDFDVSGTPYVATVAPGFYTPADLVGGDSGNTSAVSIALTNAYAGTTWYTTYDTDAPGLVMIGGPSLGPALTILFSTGPNLARSIGTTLGFAVEDLNLFDALFLATSQPAFTAGVDATNPMIMMRQSRDGGKTWGAEQWRSAGKVGEYSKRARWNRCGSGRRMVFEVVMTDPIPYRIMDATLELGQPLKGQQQQQAAQ